MTRPKTTLLITTPGARVKTRGNKKQKTAPSSSTPRTIMPERGIDLENMEGWLEEDVHALNWELFVEPPSQAISEFIMEFLRIASADDLPTLTIKKVKVNFTETEINASLGTTSVPEAEDEYVRYCAERNNKKVGQEILQAICYEGAEWLSGEALERKVLKFEAKVWMHFINSRLIPASHDSRVNWERAVLVFCILQKKKFDVGRIIYEQLIDNIGRKKAPFYFPCLISEICRRAGLKAADSEVEETIPMVTPINLATISRIRKNEGTEEEEEEEEKEEEKGKEGKKEGEETDSASTKEEKSTAMKPPTRKPANNKGKKVFEGPSTVLVSQTAFGYGADLLVKTIQNIEKMVGEELMHVTTAANEMEKEIEQYKKNDPSSKKRKLEFEGPSGEQKTLKELADAVQELLEECRSQKKETEQWKEEVREMKKGVDDMRERELQLWRYIKARDQAFDANWDNKFKNQIRIPAFPDILAPEAIEDAPKDGASSAPKQ